MKYLNKPKFEIRFHHDTRDEGKCPMCDSEDFKIKYHLSFTKHHFLLDKVLYCGNCSEMGADWSMGTFGVSWFQHWVNE